MYTLASQRCGLEVSTPIWEIPVLAKYAGHAEHVRQTSADDIAGHFFRQVSIHEKCPASETRIADHELKKMSSRGSKCPAEH